MRVAVLRALSLLALSACSSAATTGSPTAPVRSASGQRVEATLAGVRLRLEVANDDRERAVGLMGRTSVPPGTGMLFHYDAPSTGRYYMFHVPIPLRATFLSGGVVLSTVVMPPCRQQDPYACPTYGTTAPFDAVVETAPATLADVAAGDRLVVPTVRSAP